MAENPITDQAMNTYRGLMTEIKFRTDAIEGVLRTDIGPKRAKIAEEFCFLQLRMICEAIAIACLVLHGNLKPKADLFKTYKADWIMSELGKLHPRFFPTALETGGGTAGDGDEWVGKTSGFLTKDELQQLWSRHCGSKLHHGTAKQIIGQKEPPIELPEVAKWRKKIIRLLERHILITADEQFVFYVVMNHADHGKVATNLFRRLPPDAPRSTPHARRADTKGQRRSR
jgi:hypothetical protein